MFFSQTLKVKKKPPNMNFPHQNEQFDTNIVHFDGLNQCQWHVFLYTSEIQFSLSLLSKLGKKITKINFYNKIKLKKHWENKIIKFTWFFKFKNQSSSFAVKNKLNMVKPWLQTSSQLQLAPKLFNRWTDRPVEKWMSASYSWLNVKALKVS